MCKDLKNNKRKIILKNNKHILKLIEKKYTSGYF